MVDSEMNNQKLTLVYSSENDTAPSRTASYLDYISYLKRDRRYDSRLRKFLIRAIYKQTFPDKQRVVVTIENWEDKAPYKIKIDSQSKHCNDCGRKAYYIVYHIRDLKLGWRLCWEHLQQRDRDMLAEYLWCYNE